MYTTSRIPGRLILASKSPRRIQLLNQVGLCHEVIPSSVEETIKNDLSPEDNVRELALAKAMDVAEKIDKGVVIGADTIVVLGNEYLGKPVDKEDAVRMLRRLRGRTHSVLTGFAIVERPGSRFVVDAERTSVTFRFISDEEVDRYVAGGSPFDKAGAYGIQDDYGAVFVSKIEGCFYNVVGFPLSKFHTVFSKFLNGNPRS